MSPANSIHVLAVDDEPDLCALTKSFLEASWEMEVHTVCSVAEAMAALLEGHYDAIVSDYQMPMEDGIQFLKSLRGKGDQIPFILFTGKGREEVVIEALNSGADSYLQKGGKPASLYKELAHRIRDAVRRHRAEEALQKSEARFNQLAEHAGTIAWEVDADGLFSYVSHVSEAVWGYRPDELVGKKHFYDLHPESGREAFKKAALDIFERRERFHGLVNPVQAWDGQTVWVTTDGIPLLNQDGSLMGYQGSDTDITDRKRAEQALKEREEYLRAILQSTADGFWMVDSEGKMIDVNEAYCRMLGYSRAELLELHIPNIDALLTLEEQAATLQRICANGSGVFETRHRRKDGSTFDVELSVKHQNTSGGRLVCFCRDITERKLMDQALRESEEKFRLLIESSHDIIYTVTPDGIFTFISPSWTTLLGHPVGEVVGRPFQQFVHADDRAACMAFLQRTAETGQRQSGVEYRVRHADGSWRWHTSNAVPLVDDSGRFVGLEGNARDITERKRAEIELRKSQQMLSRIMDTTPNLIYIYNLKEHRNLYANHEIVDFLGFTSQQIIDMGPRLFELILHPDDAGAVEEYQERLRNSPDGEVLESEYRMQRADGSWCWLRSHDVIYDRDPDGTVNNELGFAEDVTEKKRVEEELRESKARLQTLVQTIPDLVWLKNTEGEYLTCNSALERLFDAKEASIVGKTDYEFFDREMADSFLEHDQDAMSAGKPTKNEEWVTFANDGHRALLETIKSPMYDAKGELVGVLGIGRDITERKRVEEALYEANRKLNLLSSITRHDIANQLLLLTGNLALLEAERVNPTSCEQLQKAEAAAERVTAIIQFTKEYQDIGVKAPAWASPGRQTANAFELLHPNGVDLEDDTKGIEVLADPLAEKVHYNLVDNSMRHGEHVARIRIGMEQVGDAMLIIYEDDGVGITDESKQRLFERGFGKNTGFGLFLCREILAITGITITETGKEGEGVRFEMLVPAGVWRSAPR